MSKRHSANLLNPLRVQGSDEKTLVQKLNTHCFQLIRPFPVPLDEGSHSLEHSTISWITLHFYHCFCDSTPPVSFPSTRVKQRGPETNEATALSVSEPWPRALGRGLCHPGLGLWSWFLLLLLERWWWPQPREEHSTCVLLPQWKRQWSKVSKDQQQVDASAQRPWSAMSLRPMMQK